VKKIITGYGDSKQTGEGAMIMDELVEIARDKLGVKIEGDGDKEITDLYRITITIEKLT